MNRIRNYLVVSCFLFALLSLNIMQSFTYAKELDSFTIDTNITEQDTSANTTDSTNPQDTDNITNPTNQEIINDLSDSVNQQTPEDSLITEVTMEENQDSYEKDSSSYIAENINPLFSKPQKMEVADALIVKQTFAKRSLMPHNNLSIDALWSDSERGFGKAFITMNQSAVEMYNTDDDSEYFVAFINPMVNDKNIETTQIIFGIHNYNGITYNDCVYDKNTGLAYIPKKYTTEPNLLFQSQVQLLQIVSSQDETSAVKIEIMSDSNGEISSSYGTGEAKITDIQTNLNLSSNLSSNTEKGDLNIYINESETPWEDFSYNKDSKILSINIPPSNIDSIRIDVDKQTIIHEIFEKIRGTLVSVLERDFVYAADFGLKRSKALPYQWTYDGNISSLKGQTFILTPQSINKQSGNLVIYNNPEGVSNVISGDIGVGTNASIDGVVNGSVNPESSPGSFVTKNNPGTVALGFYYRGTYVHTYRPEDGWDSHYSPAAEYNQKLIANYILNGSTVVDWSQVSPQNFAGTYGVTMPKEFKLNNVSLKGVNLDHLMNAGERAALLNKNTGEMIIPMMCAHISSPMGVESSFDKIAVRIIDYSLDARGDGKALVGFLGQQTSQGSQTMYSVVTMYLKKATGFAEVSKTSSVPDITNNNPMYDMKDIKYGIFTDSSCNNFAKDISGNTAILNITDYNYESSSALTNIIEIPPGNYFLKELSDSNPIDKTGYITDDNIYPITITEGKTTSIPVKEIPAGDPIKIVVQKFDLLRDKGEKYGVANAEYTVKYYDRFFNEEETEELKSQDPESPAYEHKRSWTFKSDEKGNCLFIDEYKVGGDDLFYIDNTPTLPLGTITIAESTPPEGYFINPTVYVATTTPSGDGTILTENLPINDNATGDYPILAPVITSYAKDKSSGNQNGTLSNNSTIIDTVQYKNLLSETDYTMKGTLIDKQTKKALCNEDGKIITGTTKFTSEKITGDNPGSSTGEVQVKFSLNSFALAGKDIVIYEELYKDDKLLAEHKDINEKLQTISYPSISKSPITGQIIEMFNKYRPILIFFCIILVAMALFISKKPLR